MECLLALSHAGKCYGTRAIFKDITCSVPAGSINLLAGANGAGKSTLMRVMAGLSRLTAGTVSQHVAAEAVGYLGHATFVYPALSALENLAFWRNIYGLKADERALIDLLRRVELERFAHERSGTFSRGMAQRLNLARVLLLQPRLLLLDEPATGLDTRSAALLRAEIAAAKAGGAGIVWISHDVAGDAAMADTVWFLHDKKLAYAGSAAGFIQAQGGAL